MEDHDVNLQKTTLVEISMMVKAMKTKAKQGEITVFPAVNN